MLNMKYILKMCWTFVKLHKRVPISAFLGSEHTAVREQVLCKASLTDRDELVQEDRGRE